jgi:hypothetical protein
MVLLRLLRDIRFDRSAVSSVGPAVLREAPSDEDANKLDSIMNEQQVFGSGIYGDGETNDGGITNILPIYDVLAANQSTTLCSNSAEGAYNGVDVR